MNSAIDVTMDEQQLNQLQIDSTRLKLLLQQGVIAIVTNLTIALITATLLSSVLDHFFLWFWVLLSVMISLARIKLNYSLKKRLSIPAEQLQINTVNRYENYYAVGLLISGIKWGLLGFMINPHWPLSQQLIIPLMLGGMSAGAVSGLMSSLKSHFCYVVPMSLPVCYGLYQAQLIWAGVAVFIYLIVILLLAANINRKLIESIQLRLDNSDLVKHLQQTNQRQTELVKQLQQKEVFLKHTFEQAGVPMVLVDRNYHLIDANQAACRLSGYSKEELRARTVADMFHQDDSKEVSPYFLDLMSGERDQYVITKRFANKSGEPLWLQSTISAVRDDKGEVDYIVVQSQDITQEYVLTQNLSYQARHDALTGLPNRLAFEQRLQETIEDREQGDEHVVCYIDLDQFKVVNDTCGHIAGDQLLKQLATVLKQGLRKADMLARIGGDEFAVLLFNCSLDVAIKQLEALLNKIREFNFIYGEHSFKVGASMGLVILDDHSTLVEALKHADSACYAAKEAGRNRIHVYRHDDEQLAQRSGEMRWVSRIQLALKEKRLMLFSQRIISIQQQSDSLPHYELLIRMRETDGSIIAPGQFLPAAERYNLAAEIDMWVVQHVLDKLTTAKKQGLNIRGVYGINLSGHSLGDTRFYEQIIQLIRMNDLSDAQAYLCFEITETAAISNMGAAIHFITDLRNVGCQFALDDFGSGLSSFAYLKQLPIDYLKIDGMFVKNCLSDSVNLEIIDAINDIGHVMGLKTIAEFVEDEQVVEALKIRGIDYVQGYFNGMPSEWQLGGEQSS